MKNNTGTILNKLYILLVINNKKLLVVLLLMSIFLSTIEAIGIASLMPFITVAANPNIVYENSYYIYVYKLFEFASPKNFIIYFGIALVIFYIFKAFYSVFYTFMQNKFAMNRYKKLTNKLFINYLYLSYDKFINKNSASMSKVIISEALQLSFIIQFILSLISEIFIICIMYIILLYVDLYMTLILTLFFLIMIILLGKTVSRQIKVKGMERAIEQEKYFRIINEIFGNFKFIKFASNQSEIINKFKIISKKYARVYIYNNTLQDIPRNAIESVGLTTLITISLYIIITVENSENFIPIIIMYALALYRVLPAMNRIITSYNGIIFYLSSLDIVYKDINIQNTVENEASIFFQSNINIDNITFSYIQKKNIINNLTLGIEKGQKIAFVGESGSGKSTLVDLICGIYRPNSGKIFIDNVELDNSNIVSWRKKIGYIPQSIYLFDGTIADNISFGREYNEDKLIKVLKQANIYDVLIEKEGLDTMVGEGGIQLSGGQKQRIGIARALYGEPEILVLDEATSALDSETEKAIMDEIYKISEDKTLMIIAHRLSTIEKCDVRIDLEKINNYD
jgi:ATP-binding cassette subfamily B protein/ATP-binding cassette subfamily C protein